MNDDPLVTLKPYVDFRESKPKRWLSPGFAISLIIIFTLLLGCFFIIRTVYSASLYEPRESVCRDEFRHIVECP